jgi:hypothetical protein
VRFATAPVLSVTLSPSQKVVALPATIDAPGKGLTVIFFVAVAVHPAALVTDTVYVVVMDGLATGLLVFGLLNPIIGDQLKFSPPDAVSMVELRLQMEELPVIRAGGSGFTVTVLLALLNALRTSVTVTLKVLVTDGFTKIV